MPVWLIGKARDINACSIGIELAHQGPDAHGDMSPFPARQMQALVALCRILKPDMKFRPHGFWGIAMSPQRKIDPGAAFDWQWLATQGFGVYSTAVNTGKPTLTFGDKGNQVADLRTALGGFWL